MLRGRVRACALATLCGYARDGQAEALAAEVRALLGVAPDPVAQFVVGDLVPEADRGKVTVVSARVVRSHELAVYAAQIDRLVARLGC